MKTSQDPRHLKRIQIMQELFAWDFTPKNRLQNPTSRLIVEHLEQIDLTIAQAAPTWPIDKINKIDLAILRQAVYELTIEPSTPLKVIVDEAVELGKEFGSESSPGFVNGVLGKVIQEKNIR